MCEGENIMMKMRMRNKRRFLFHEGTHISWVAIDVCRDLLFVNLRSTLYATWHCHVLYKCCMFLTYIDQYIRYIYVRRGRKAQTMLPISRSGTSSGFVFLSNTYMINSVFYSCTVPASLLV